MATNFPTSLDALTNPTSTSTLTSPSHASQHADANDAIEALQAKVGVNSSAVTTSLDYKVENILATPRAYRNLIINGAMQVDQRCTATTAKTDNGYSVDRWYIEDGCDAVISAQQSTDVPSGQGFVNSLKCTATTADASIGSTQFSVITHHIEGTNSACLGWGASGAKKVTASFWVKASVTGTYSFTLYNNGAARIYPASYTVSAANTWEKKTITIAGDTTGTWLTTTGRGVVVNFYTALGSTYLGTANAWNASAIYGATGQANAWATVNNIFAITGVQIEIGEVATPFEFEPFETTLRKCMRYFEKSFNYATAPAHNQGTFSLHNNCGSLGCGGNTYFRIDYKVTKRAAPTMRFYDPSATHTASENWWRSYGGCGAGTAVQNASALSFFENCATGYMAYATDAGFAFDYTLDAEL